MLQIVLSFIFLLLLVPRLLDCLASARLGDKGRGTGKWLERLLWTDVARVDVGSWHTGNL